MRDDIAVEVVFALPDRQWRKALRLPRGASLRQAIDASGIGEVLAGLVVDDDNVGIFSRPATLATALRDGDRVEIYRPLTRDPKDTRRLRARQQKR
jgi:putative ubiquitin-RnfH superfamily antitoxin RatB of RatAB toxin-antitoxin module